METQSGPRRARRPGIEQWIAVYLRVSTADQREGKTIETQRVEVQKWLEGHPELHLFDWYEDNGVSSEVPFPKRPEGQRLLGDAEAGRFGMILCWHQDRLFRYIDDLCITNREFRRLGLIWRSVVQNFAADDMGDLMRMLTAGMSQQEKRRIVERSVAGKNRIVAEGRFGGGKPKLGYRINAHGYFEIEPVEAEVVRQLFQGYADMLSVAGLAKRMNAQGVLTPARLRDPLAPTLGRWGRSTILRILKDPIYYGEGLYRRKREIRVEGVVVTRERRPDADLIRFSVPPIIARELWEEVQRRIRERENTNPESERRSYPLRELLVCASCGKRLMAGGVAYTCDWHYYKCRSLTACELAKVRAEPLEAALWRRIRQFATHPQETLDALQTRLSSMASQEADVALRVDRLDAEARRQAEITENTVTATIKLMAINSAVTPEQANTMIAKEQAILDEKRSAARAARDQLEALRQSETALHSTGLMLRKLGTLPAEPPPTLMRAVFKLLIEEIQVTQYKKEGKRWWSHQFHVTWKFGHEDADVTGISDPIALALWSEIPVNAPTVRFEERLLIG